MSIVFQNAVKADLNSGSGTTTVTLTDNAIGSFWIGCIALDAFTHASLAMGDSAAAAGWTVLFSDATVSPDCAVIYKYMTSADASVDIELSNNPTAGYGAFMAYRFTGVDPSVPLDGVTMTRATGATGDPDPPAITPVSSDSVCVVIGALDDDRVTSSSGPSGYSNSDFKTNPTAGSGGGDNATVSMAWRQLSGTSEESPGAFTTDGDDQWEAFSVILRTAAEVASNPSIRRVARFVGGAA